MQCSKRSGIHNQLFVSIVQQEIPTRYQMYFMCSNRSTFHSRSIPSAVHCPQQYAHGRTSWSVLLQALHRIVPRARVHYCNHTGTCLAVVQMVWPEISQHSMKHIICHFSMVFRFKSGPCSLEIKKSLLFLESFHIKLN